MSERILMLAVGARCADVIIEGSGVTAEDSDVAEISDEELEPDSALATPGGVASLTKSVRHCVRVGKVSVFFRFSMHATQDRPPRRTHGRGIGPAPWRRSNGKTGTKHFERTTKSWNMNTHSGERGEQ